MSLKIETEAETPRDEVRCAIAELYTQLLARGSAAVQKAAQVRLFGASMLQPAV